MTWTQQQYIDAVKDALDGVGNSRWGAVAINNALSIAHRTEWRHILKAAPAYRLQVLPAVTDANGQIPLANLTTGAADVKKRFFQVLGKRLYVGNVPYEWANPVEHAYAVGQPTNYGTSFMWWRADQVLQLLPVEAGLNVIIPVNHFPTAIGALSGTGVVAEFPEDYEPIVVNSAAALLLAKGDAEVQGTADFARIASAMRESLLSEVSHISADSPVVRAGDSPSEWGG